MEMEYVSVKDGRFVLGAREVKLKGVNYSDPRCPWVWTRNWNRDAAHEGLRAAAGLGVNCVRVWTPSSPVEFDPGAPDPVYAFAEFVNIAELYGICCYVGLRWEHKYSERGSLDDKANLNYLDVIMGIIANDPRIVALDLINEADHVGGDIWHWAMDPAEAARRLQWLRRMRDEVKKRDAAHLVSMGAVFSYSFWKPVEPFTLDSIVDFVDFHYYRRNYREATLGETIREVREHTDKPIVVGETGFTSDPKYSTLGEPEHSEELQAKIIDEMLADCEMEGASGIIPWVLTDYTKRFKSGESSYGILRANYEPKPVTEVFAGRFKAAKIW